MALVASRSNSDHRIYDPSVRRDYPVRVDKVSACRSRLLAKIHAAYRTALQRLTVNARRRFLSGGGNNGGALCIGLLDPVSNIIVNALVPGVIVVRADAAAATLVVVEDLARRSLDGLLTFLTRFFPYLDDREALYYLLLADANALVVRDRGMKRFGCSDPPVINEEGLTKALKCAALVAGHPDPDRLVEAWLAVSGRVDAAATLLANLRRHSRAPPEPRRSSEAPRFVQTDAEDGSIFLIAAAAAGR
ncbi:hypothetical protein PR202_gb00441 [Eleusine coracana subsp. coracana]|uniref:PIR2-like helical domain-containing protein n=1 Tax=Eleusine coracana subsp. coracana TaxID=191504 RepID=A0AAV5DU14_ELECO|nr:hypothetical protein PR202_gb00441 [Eleusine coracana subsp. coracana]